jgi:hypothetical protein
MKQSTNVGDNTWLPRCRVPDCELERKRCPVCKHGGHIKTHIKSTKRGHVEMKMVHGHFVENQDAGRNIAHDIGIDKATEQEIRESWRLTKEGEARLIKKWNARFQ